MIKTELPDYKPGQIWANKKRNPTLVLMITKTWVKEYADGRTVQRVTGFQALALETYYDELETAEIDLDARSVQMMFSYPFWCPVQPEDTENK